MADGFKELASKAAVGLLIYAGGGCWFWGEVGKVCKNSEMSQFSVE